MPELAPSDHYRALDIRDEGSARARRDVHLVQHGIGAERVGGRKAVPIAHRAARSIIFQHFAVVGVRHIDRGGTADRLRLAPALRVVDVSGDRAGWRAAAARHDPGEPALGVVAIGGAAIVSEIAVAVVGRAHGTDRRVLVEIVGGVADVRRRGGISPPAVVGCSLSDAPVDGIVPKAKLALATVGVAWLAPESSLRSVGG